MLYRHAHALLALEGYEHDSDTIGKAFRIRPADQDAPDAQQSFVLWSTLTTRGEVPGESDPDEKPDPTRAASLVLEVSADGKLWVPMDPHVSDQPARVLRVPFLLPFVRARVYTRALKVEAHAVLLGSSPFSLHAQVTRDAVVVVGRSG